MAPIFVTSNYRMTKIPVEQDLQGANLTGAQLNFAVLNRAKLRNADLHGAWLIGADLAEADLIGTILEGMGTAAWSGKTEQKNTRSSPQQDTALPDLFADWQQEETSRRSVDEIPVIEASSFSNKAQEICFWHYLLGLKMKQKAAQERHQLDIPLNNEEQSVCVIPCPVPNTTELPKTSQSSQGRK